VIRGVARRLSRHPQHPLHIDPGDHVDAAQLLDCAMQASHLLMCPEGVDPKAPLRCRSGRAQFRKFVELDCLFEVILQRRHDLPRAQAVRGPCRGRLTAIVWFTVSQ
jgi:hypothetical protein